MISRYRSGAEKEGENQFLRDFYFSTDTCNSLNFGYEVRSSEIIVKAIPSTITILWSYDNHHW
jgi:hypothetical protein